MGEPRTATIDRPRERERKKTATAYSKIRGKLLAKREKGQQRHILQRSEECCYPREKISLLDKHQRNAVTQERKYSNSSYNRKAVSFP